MKRLVVWLPLAVFVALLWVVAHGLRSPSDPTIRSHLIGKPMPDFALEAIVPNHPGLRTVDLRAGKPRLVNVFASWCVPCRAEAPQLLELKQRGVPIDAVAVRDRSEDVAAFLADSGDPFDRIGSDPRTQVQFALGSSGVPETFVVDGRGVIRLQHVGPIMPQDLSEIFSAYEAAR